MTSRNDVTGDLIQTKASTQAYRDNKFWDKRRTDQAETELKAIQYPEPRSKADIDEQVRKLTDYLTTCTQSKES